MDTADLSYTYQGEWAVRCGDTWTPVCGRSPLPDAGAGKGLLSPRLPPRPFLLGSPSLVTLLSFEGHDQFKRRLPFGQMRQLCIAMGRCGEGRRCSAISSAGRCPGLSRARKQLCAWPPLMPLLPALCVLR